MIPLRDENPAQRAPIVTRTLIALNVVGFMAELAQGDQLRAFIQAWGFVPERLAAAFAGSGELSSAAITLITSMFLHGGWLHLLGNMWYLWIFGDNVEDRLGHAAFLAFYLSAGLVSALAHAFFNFDSPVPTVGASGAIAGVLGAYALAFPRARVVTLVPVFFFFQVIALPAMLVLGLWFVFQFFSGALSVAGAGSGGVAWWAHIGGFAFGYALMAWLVRPRARSEAWVER